MAAVRSKRFLAYADRVPKPHRKIGISGIESGSEAPDLQLRE